MCSTFQISKSWSAFLHSKRVWNSALCRSGHSEPLVRSCVLLAHVLWQSRYVELAAKLKKGNKYQRWHSDRSPEEVHEEYEVPPLRLLSWKPSGNLEQDFVSRFWPLSARLYFVDSEGVATTTQEMKGNGPVNIHIDITNHSSVARYVGAGRGFDRDRPVQMSLVSGTAIKFMNEDHVAALTSKQPVPTALTMRYVGKSYRCGTGMHDYQETILPHSTSSWVTRMKYLLSSQDEELPFDPYSMPKPKDSKKRVGPVLRTNCWEVEVGGVANVALMAAVYSSETNWQLGDVGRELLCCSNLLTICLPQKNSSRKVEVGWSCVQISAPNDNM